MASNGWYRAELGEGAVRAVLEREREHAWRWGAVCSVADELGPWAESVRKWVQRAEIDSGGREGVATAGRQRVNTLERENRELRRANEILKAAASLFG